MLSRGVAGSAGAGSAAIPVLLAGTPSLLLPGGRGAKSGGIGVGGLLWPSSSALSSVAFRVLPLGGVGEDSERHSFDGVLIRLCCHNGLCAVCTGTAAAAGAAGASSNG